MANFSDALKELASQPIQPMNPKAKRPAKINADSVANGEGSFVIVGDWGNPFTPGGGPCEDGGPGCPAYWGPHYRCNTGQAKGTRCEPGSAAYVRDDMAQLNVAKHMTAWAKQNLAQFVVNVGDNLYPQGFDSVNDSKWEKVFENRYPDEALQIPWLSCLGNHDWGGFNCFMDSNGRLTRADTQIAYDTEPNWEWPANKESRWVLPAPYYKKRISFGDVTIDIVAIDTNFAKVEEPCGEDPNSQRACDASNKEDGISKCRTFLANMRDNCWDFLESELSASNATWKFVFAHHPLSFLGNWFAPQQNIVERLKKLNVSAYIGGHTHRQTSSWYTHTEGKSGIFDGEQRPGAIFEILSGGGGGAWSDAGGNEMYGFVGLKVTKDKLVAEFISDENTHWATFTLGPPCHQYHGSTCEWTAADWDDCVDGTRARNVSCSRGPAEYCANSAKPEAHELCTSPSPSPAPSPSPSQGPSPSPSPGPSPSPSPGPAPSPSPDAKTGGGIGIALIAVAVVGAVAAVGVLGYCSMRGGRLCRHIDEPELGRPLET